MKRHFIKAQQTHQENEGTTGKLGYVNNVTQDFEALVAQFAETVAVQRAEAVALVDTINEKNAAINSLQASVKSMQMMTLSNMRMGNQRNGNANNGRRQANNNNTQANQNNASNRLFF